MKTYNEINRKINKLTKSGQIQKAIEYCQSVLMNEPSNTALCVRLGDLYMDWHLDVYQAKQYIDEAITQYQRAAESLIDDSQIYYKIGFAFYHKGELDRAINYFNLAIKQKLQQVADKAVIRTQMADEQQQRCSLYYVGILFFFEIKIEEMF